MKRIFAALVLALMLPAIGHAQTKVNYGLTVKSSPPGAEVILKGETRVTGVTPTTFRFPLVGDYKITVKRKGFESYKSHLTLDPSRPTQLDVELAHKTGLKAGVRSWFIPGWGQFYNEQKTKGVGFALLFGGAVAAYFIADSDFNDKESELARLQTEFDNVDPSESYAQRARRLDLIRAAREEAYDAEDVRRVTIGAAIGVWGLNVLDALLFSPKERAVVTVQGVSLTPTANVEGVGLTLSSSF